MTGHNRTIDLLKIIIMISNYLFPPMLQFKKPKENKMYNCCKVTLYFLALLVQFYGFYFTLTNVFINRPFIIRASGGVYVFINVALIIVIFITNKINENKIGTTLNKLFSIQTHRRESFPLEDIFICLTVVQVIMGIVSWSYFTISNITPTESLLITVCRVVFSAVFLYFIVLGILTEARCVVTFSLVTQYFHNLDEIFLQEYRIRLRGIMIRHYRLCELAREVNETFSVILLFLIAHYFVNVVLVFLSLSYSLLQREKLMNNSIVSCITTLLKLITIIACLARCGSKANKLKITICKVLCETKDAKLRKELNAYGLQLFHETVEITAAGFFKIDSTLIFTIVSAASTYVVIILQFLVYDQQYIDNIKLWDWN